MDANFFNVSDIDVAAALQMDLSEITVDRLDDRNLWLLFKASEAMMADAAADLDHESARDAAEAHVHFAAEIKRRVDAGIKGWKLCPLNRIAFYSSNAPAWAKSEEKAEVERERRRVRAEKAAAKVARAEQKAEKASKPKVSQAELKAINEALTAANAAALARLAELEAQLAGIVAA